MGDLFVGRHVPDVVGLLLDASIPAGEGEQGRGIGLPGGEAGGGVADLGLRFAGPLADAAALDVAELMDDARMGDMGPNAPRTPHG